tara:strand:+ start:2432 stop:2773 length:342 start_codon:yes stop_codon:yes gene_type:complete
MPSLNNRNKQGGRILAENPQQMAALDRNPFPADKENLMTAFGEKAAATKAPIEMVEAVVVETPSRVSNDTWMNNLSPELKLKYEKYLKQQRDYVNNTNLTDLDVLITISDGLY